MTMPSEKDGSAMKRIKHWWWLLPLFVLTAVVIAFVIWAGAAASPMPEAIAALELDNSVTVQTEPWLMFNPVETAPQTGLILYPGARVDPGAYAPAARAIAEQGYLVIIAPMPLNLAILAPDRASQIMEAFPQLRIGQSAGIPWVEPWHSLCLPESR